MLKTNPQLARLNISRATGDLDGDGDYDRLDVFGARSISIRDHKGELVWDSQNFFERLSRDQDLDNPAASPLFSKTLFNVSNANSSRDNRSDDKSIEPEAVVVGVVNGVRYAFVGLERDSGIAVFDLTDPATPAFVTYVNNRKFKDGSGAFLACSNTVDCGDLGPEGLTFVPASQSPNGRRCSSCRTRSVRRTRSGRSSSGASSGTRSGKIRQRGDPIWTISAGATS